MAWDDDKATGDEIAADEWDTHVADQKSRSEIGWKTDANSPTKVSGQTSVSTTLSNSYDEVLVTVLARAQAGTLGQAYNLTLNGNTNAVYSIATTGGATNTSLNEVAFGNENLGTNYHVIGTFVIQGVYDNSVASIRPLGSVKDDSGSEAVGDALSYAQADVGSPLNTVEVTTSSAVDMILDVKGRNL